ncbi:MAG: S46 family peptidase, partial [Bryobacteraceae bacterium]
NRFVYTEEQARSVHVASQAIIEALDKVYGARRLLAELGVK